MYLAIALIFFARALPHHFFDYYVGRDTDSSFYMWLLAWWPYAIRHHLNPLLPKIVWAPYGTNLTWSTSMPLVGLAASPLSAALGIVAASNVIALLSAPLAAGAAYVLCRYLTGSNRAALAGGFIFGFSPYMTGEILCHYVLLLVFPVPLALYLVLRRLDGGIARTRFIALLTVLLVTQFLMLMEALALMAMLGGLALAIAAWLAAPEERRRIVATAVEIGAACTLTAFFAVPYLYYFLFGGFPKHPLWPADQYSADLLNFVIPTAANAIGDNSLLRAISSRFPGNLYEQGACLGLPLMVIAAAWTRRHRGELHARVLAAILVIASILAMGPYLHIGGRPVSLMPWLIVEHLPLIRSALPIRLMPFAFLAAAIIFSLWITDPETRPYARVAGVALTILLMLPNLASSFWVSPINLPAFFRDGSSHRFLSRDDIVLPLPFGQKGNSMLWQAASGMNFRMASGLTGVQIQQITRWPIVGAFYGSIDLPDPELQVKAFIANTGITAIVADASDRSLPAWKALLAPLGIEPREISGVLLFRIPAGALDGYRKYGAVAMEQRAARIRFDAAVTAAARYLRSGGALDGMSVPALQAAGLLPAGWKFDPTPTAFRDIWAIPLSHKPAIGVIGSVSAVRPIIESYQADAEAVMFPAPRIWNPAPRGILRSLFDPSPANSTSGEDTGLMLMVFAPDRLQQLAARIAAQPALSPASTPREASRLSPSR